jgi:ABC-type phosphate transport system substrate-binding protein
MKCLVAATILFILQITVTSTAYAQIAVIVNPANPNDISTGEIERIFLGKVSNFADGSRAIPLNLAEANPARDEFNNKVLNRDAAQVKAHWSKMVFAGKGKLPTELGDDAAVKAEVARNPNAISYIQSSSIDGSVRVVARY